MKILSFIFSNITEVLVAMALIIGLIVATIHWFQKSAPMFQKMSSEEIIAYIKRLLANLVPIALGLVTDAEKKFGGGTGKLKRSYVIDELYKRIPDEYKKYVIEDNLDTIIDDALLEAEPLWSTNTDVQKIVYGGNNGK